MLPKLLGYILDTVVTALKIKSTLELTNLPRMADFTMWGEAIARAMKNKPMEFIDAFNENIGRQNVEAIESNPLAQTIEKFVNSLGKNVGNYQPISWEGSSVALLRNLNNIAQVYNIDTDSKFWPKTRQLSDKKT